MLKIQRFCYSDKGTFSNMSMGGIHWYGVEKPWRDNQPYISCIPEGIYYAERYESPTEGRGIVWQFNHVPGRTHIQIHKGNWESDVVGCIAPGKRLGSLPKKGEIVAEWCVLESSKAMQELTTLTAHLDSLTIEITQYRPMA